MSTLLLDTDVFSYLFKGHSLADAYRSHVKGQILAISFMTVAYVFQGAFRAGWAAKRIERLEEQIKSYLGVSAYSRSSLSCRFATPAKHENGAYQRRDGLTDNKVVSPYFQGRTKELVPILGAGNGEKCGSFAGISRYPLRMPGLQQPRSNRITPSSPRIPATFTAYQA